MSADACPRCGLDDERYEGRYGPMSDGAYVCFNCMSAEVRADREWTPPLLRVGRKVGRTLYMQVGIEPSDDDPLVGMMDTRELASIVAASFSDREERASVVLYGLLRGLSYGISLDGCPACDGWSNTAETAKWETGHSEDCDLRPIEDAIEALRQLAFPTINDQ